MECCLSHQEQMLENKIKGLDNPYRATHQRVFKILETIENLTPSIDIQRALYFTQSMAETEGQHLTLRWAKAMYKVAENIDVFIDDDNLLCGRAGAQGRYGILYPELDGDFLGMAVKELPSRENSPFTLTQADADVIINEIAPYWKGKTYHEDLNNAFSPETHALTYNDPEGLHSRYIVNETSSFRSCLQWVHDYEVILKRGFGGIREEMQEKLDALDPFSPIDNTEKKPFIEAIIMVCDAISLWANRHADLADQKAAAEKDETRKAELLEMARICRKVPERPAETFHEAVQSQWFTQMFSRLEQKTGTIVSNGRMDQYLYPFYEKDVEAGRMDELKAMELIECMFVSMAQFIDLYISPQGGDFNEGYAHWEAVTIGGQNKNGVDATNELSHLFLRSKREFPHHYPDLAARIHARAPQSFLADIAETIKEGSGFPKLINDEEVIPLHLSKGAKFEEIYDYAISGCAEIRMPNRDTYTSGCPYINFAAAVEMVMYDGKMLKYGDEQLAPATGDPCEFKTFDEFLAAYTVQHRNLLKHGFAQEARVIDLRKNHFAAPLADAMHALCRKHCVDIHQPDVPEGIDLGYFEVIGYGTVIDSLTAIKKVVFEDKKLTMKQVIDACKADFIGYEDVQALLRTAPCYGNNDEYADEIGRYVDSLSVEFAEKYQDELGVHLDVRYVPFTSHVPFGRVVSATPNGRVAWYPLSDGSSASHGADKNGPTAILMSNYTTKNFSHRERAARLVNIKFTPKCLEGEEGTLKMVDFIRSFCDLRLWHIQFNVINAETLVKAQKNPEQYRSLIVRIAGYSAYFCDLSKDLQDDLIARTSHGAM